MSDLDHLIWFLATAAMTIVVLTVGTLFAAGLLPRGSGGEAERPGRQAPPPEPAVAPEYREVGTWAGGEYPPGAVVVGYDGKGHSHPALDWAADEAADRGAPLVVLYAAHYPGMDVEPGPGLHHRDPGALEAAEEVTARGVASAAAGRPGLDVVGATEVTAPARALVDASRDAGLVVVGSRRLGRVAAAVRGSVGSEVAARASSPVVTVAPAESRVIAIEL